MRNNILKSLEGIIVPLITPIADNGTIDIEGLNNLIEHVISGGVNGIFILGTTGESQNLAKHQRELMITETSKILRNRLPLLVGISDTSIKDSINLAQKAFENGADAVVSTPPYYFSTGQSELINYFEKLLDQLSLPLFLYNMPVHTKVNFNPITIKEIASNKKVIGFKDSSGNGTYLQSVMYTMKDNPEFKIFAGQEEMTAEMVLMGASGGVNGGANLFPKLYVALYQAAKSNKIEKVRELQQNVMQISTNIYTKSPLASSYLRGLKYALSSLDICKGNLSIPFTQYDKKIKIEIRKAMDEIIKNLNPYYI